MLPKSVPRRKQLKGLACGIAGRFVSRNNDIDGYWALGLLYSVVAAAGTDLVRLELVNGAAEPGFRYSARLLAEFDRYLQGRLMKLGLGGYVFAATVELQFDVPPRPNLSRTTWGEPFRCCVTLVDDLGRIYQAETFGYCGRHDATKESRSTRAYAD